MNPDPNQPQESEPAVPQPAQTPVPTPEAAPEVPQAYAAAPAVEPTPAANPFGGAPVSSDTPTTPLGFQPVATIGSSPNNNPTPDFNKTSKQKKLIILIAVIVGALIVLGIAAFIALMLFTVSKKDYQDAASQFNTVSSAYSDLESKASSLGSDIGDSTSDTVFNNDTDAIQTSLTNLKSADAKLATMKAVKIGDGKKVFDTFQTKLDAYTTYVQDSVTSLKSVRPAIVACSGDSSSDSSDTTTQLSACVDALKKVGDMPNADVKQYVTTLQTQYAALLDVITKISAISDPYGDGYDQYSALRDQSYTIEDKISSAGTDFDSNNTKHSDDADPSTAANALGDFLVKKES